MISEPSWSVNTNSKALISSGILIKSGSYLSMQRSGKYWMSHEFDASNECAASVWSLSLELINAEGQSNHQDLSGGGLEELMRQKSYPPLNLERFRCTSELPRQAGNVEVLAPGSHGVKGCIITIRSTS